MNAGLVALALVTAGLVGVAMKVSTAGPPAGQSTYTAAALPTATATPSTSLAQARAVLDRDEDLTIGVLGDSTGNDGNEWVHLVSQELGQSRQVSVHTWDDKAGEYPESFRTYGDTGPQAEVWNFSAPGRSAAYPADKMAKALPRKPDLLLINFGHNNMSTNVGVELTALRQAVEEKWGTGIVTVVMVQNPEKGAREEDQAAVRGFVKKWANHNRLAYVDVATAFTKRGDISSLMLDDIHPNPKGSQVWADTVVRALQI
jgi:lysophospholipase L1-like esterase